MSLHRQFKTSNTVLTQTFKLAGTQSNLTTATHSNHGGHQESKDKENKEISKKSYHCIGAGLIQW